MSSKEIGLDTDELDFDARGKSQKDNILSTLLRTEADYQHGARKFAKDRIASLRSAHWDDYESIVAYVEAMQRFDVTFTDIRRREGVEDIAEILKTIDMYEEKYREKSKDLAFVEDQIIAVQREIFDGRDALFSHLQQASSRIEEEKRSERHTDPRIKEILEQRTYE